MAFISCKKGELPVPKHDAGDVITSAVNMESNYKWQIYFDLKTNSVVGQNLKTSWDLGFEATMTGYRIILNTSKAMFARNTGNSNFITVTDTLGFALSKRMDEPTGNLDSTAIGDWRITNNVYIIDRGYNETGSHQGFRKIQIQSVDAIKYSVRFSEINGTGDITLQINKDSAYNFSFLSFSGGGQVVQVEPPKNTWDLCFTQYLERLSTPYLVTGCLLNRNITKAKMDSLISFSEINYSTAENTILSPNINTIGYSWKTYSSGIYTTNSQMNYVIKDNEGFYYKLHFIDFYNSSGVKGNPKFEFQKL